MIVSLKTISLHTIIWLQISVVQEVSDKNYYTQISTVIDR